MNVEVVLIDSLSFSNVGINPQIGLLSLAQVLEKEYTVKVVNFDLLWFEGKLRQSQNLDETLLDCSKYIVEMEPKVIGFYTICDSYPLTVLLAKKLKEISKDSIILFGGPQASLTAKESLKKFEFIDYICVGEGELIILPLVRAIIGQKFCEIKTVNNLVYRDSGIIKSNALLPPIEDDLSKYTVKNYREFAGLFRGTMSIEVGRGCPFQCTFCSTSLFWGRHFRVKKADQIVEEMNYFHRKFNISTFKFEHDMFTADKAFIISFCQTLIAQKLPYTWTCSSRIDVLDDNIMDLMSKAKCSKIYVGVESGSQRIQKKTNKDLDLKKVKHNIVGLHRRGIAVTASFIYGFPDETICDLKETLELISFLYLNGITNIQLHMFIPLPVTEELNKVQNELYFDSDKIDLGIYHAGIFNEEVKELIVHSPEIFPQFYTFPSQVRDENISLGLFIMYLSNSFEYFPCCLKYLIKKLGLYDLYWRWSYYLTRLMKETTLNHEINNIENKYQQTYKFMSDRIRCEAQKYNDQILIDYFDAESQIVEFRTSDEKVKAFEFHFDYDEAKNSGKYIKKTSFILMKKKINVDYS